MITADGAPAGTEVTRARTELATLPDEKLVKRLSGCDVDALGVLFDRHGARAYGLALTIAGDTLLAERAVQRAFLVVWRTAGRSLADGAAPESLILSLVHRQAVSLLRSGEHREGDERRAEVAAESPAAADERGARIARALRRLPAEEREPLELAYYGGLTQTQVSERLAEPIPTIRRRLVGGLTGFRRLLADADSRERA